MFSLDPFLESRDRVREIRGCVAVHLVSTLATGYRAWHALWLERMLALLDFRLKLLFAEDVGSVRLCHFFSLPQLLRPRMFVDFELRAGHCYQPIWRILSRMIAL
jgi:hypothetical protein